ncbi:MAG TPA: hypothetical protein VKU19_19960 [Bryobacteraceae bacterium]|nr:hypothetical protein [Bryobacteraceae bacterium]
MALRKVEILVSAKVVGKYEARSYPEDSFTDQNWIELYEVPVYQLVVSGKDDDGADQKFEFQAPRFMPYYNDPKKPDTEYGARGWLSAGLSSARTITVSTYLADYEIHNRHSTFHGAIVMQGAFYIHGGPETLDDVGFGSAGCIEIIGNFNFFKLKIASLSGSSQYAAIKSSDTAGTKPTPQMVAKSDAAIKDLVSNRKLVIEMKQADAPDIKKKLTRKVKRKDLFGE